MGVEVGTVLSVAHSLFSEERLYRMGASRHPPSGASVGHSAIYLAASLPSLYAIYLLPSHIMLSIFASAQAATTNPATSSRQRLSSLATGLGHSLDSANVFPTLQSSSSLSPELVATCTLAAIFLLTTVVWRFVGPVSLFNHFRSKGKVSSRLRFTSVHLLFSWMVVMGRDVSSMHCVLFLYVMGGLPLLKLPRHSETFHVSGK